MKMIKPASHAMASDTAVLSSIPADTFAAEAGDPSPQGELMGMARAIWKARALYAAARLELADLIAKGLHTAEDMARNTGMHAPSLQRLLRALASCGVLTETEPKHFALTSLGAALRTGAPGAARAAVLMHAGDWQWKAWGHFLYSLRTGQPAMLEAFGKNFFDYLADNPEDSAHFNEAMVAIHGADGAVVVTAYDFSSCKTVVDLGGGTGMLLTTILQSYEHLLGLLVELPETVPQAWKLIKARGLQARCDVVVGDFFNEVPPGHDTYVLAHVLHDWTDEQSMPILRNCRKAIPAHGRLLIVETVLPPGDTPHPGKMMDLLMLTMTGGVERTAEEFSALLAAADFKLARVIPMANHQSIVEAVPS